MKKKRTNFSKIFAFFLLCLLTPWVSMAGDLGIFPASKTPSSIPEVNLKSSVAIIRKQNFFLEPLFRLKDVYRFCHKAQHEEDLMWATCSGTLIGKDLVLTAAHCLRSINDCSDILLVQDYRENQDIRDIRQNPNQVRACGKVVYATQPHPGRHDRDVAILQLNQPFQSEFVTNIKTDWNPTTESIYSVGYPSGTPMKVSFGYSLEQDQIKKGNSPIEYGVVNLLAPGGLSGGGVFNNNDELIGIIVRSDTNYIKEERCVREFSCDHQECPKTEVQRIDKKMLRFLDKFMAAKYIRE